MNLFISKTYKDTNDVIDIRYKILDTSTGLKCESIGVSVAGLNGGEPYNFPASKAGELVQLPCKEESNNKISKICLSSGEWDSFTHATNCETELTENLQNLKQFASKLQDNQV